MNYLKIYLGWMVVLLMVDATEAMIAASNYENFIPKKYDEDTYNWSATLNMITAGFGLFLLGRKDK